MFAKLTSARILTVFILCYSICSDWHFKWLFWIDLHSTYHILSRESI